jgi:hypothetical protein
MQSVLHVQSTFVNTSRPIATKHLPRGVLEFRRAETTRSASQTETHLQAAPVTQFKKSRYH